MRFFATAPKGVENLVAGELTALGARGVRETKAGVNFEGSLELAYRACLWSRVANRILLPLCRFPAATPAELYDGVRSIDWRQHLQPNATFAVDFSSTASAITHTQFGAQKTKDAVVDQLRERCGQRPSVELARPDVRVNVNVRADAATVSIDLSGESLHRRGYRGENTPAPLKENLAAAILIRAGWEAMAAQAAPFLDPMCGSGTLPVEAALIAADIAPGLGRDYFGFLRWRQHEPRSWQHLIDAARERRAAGLLRLPTIVGCDQDPDAVRIATMNVARAGLDGRVRIETGAISDCRPPAAPAASPGLIAVNPPYGERLGNVEELRGVYAELGAVLRERFEGWTVWVLTGNEELAFTLGLRAERAYTLFNSNVRCRLLKFRIGRSFREQR